MHGEVLARNYVSDFGGGGGNVFQQQVMPHLEKYGAVVEIKVEAVMNFSSFNISITPH
jgi:hypothetical protein